MLKNVSPVRVATLWVAAIVVVAACSALLGVSMTVNNGILWLFACLAPPSVMLIVWRGAPPATVAEVLYAADTASKHSRP